MEDESLQNAAVVLCRTDRHHRSMLPRSHWRVRMLYLGLVSNGLQAVPFGTSVGVVRGFLLYLLTMKAKSSTFQCFAMAEDLLFVRRSRTLADFHCILGRRSQDGFSPPRERPAL